MNKEVAGSMKEEIEFLRERLDNLESLVKEAEAEAAIETKSTFGGLNVGDLLIVKENLFEGTVFSVEKASEHSITVDRNGHSVEIDDLELLSKLVKIGPKSIYLTAAEILEQELKILGSGMFEYRFHVHNRTVELHTCYYGELIDVQVSICHPLDVFNKEVGKLICLYRSRGNHEALHVIFNELNMISGENQ